MAKIRDLLVFYGDGERIFADFLATVETKLRSTEETELCRLMRAYGSDKGSHWHKLYDSLRSEYAVLRCGVRSITGEPNMKKAVLSAAAALVLSAASAFARCSRADYMSSRMCIFVSRRAEAFFVSEPYR